MQQKLFKREIQQKIFKRKCDNCWAFKENACAIPNTDPDCVGCKRFISKENKSLDK